MAQKNSIVGNIGSIRVQKDNQWVLVDKLTGSENGTKAFVSIADHFWSKKEEKQMTRFIPLQAFVPKGMTISKGQLIGVDFVVNPYTDSDGMTSIAFDIVGWDLSLRSAGSRPVDPENGFRVAGAGMQSSSDQAETATEDGFMNIPEELGEEYDEEFDEELPFN